MEKIMNTSIKSKDFSISIIRLIAMLFIVTCHIMQYFDFPLAWWFNVGVQIFLCMSGFLYGNRSRIEDDILFYKKQFPKILLDYYIVIIPVIIILFVFSREHISYFTALKALITYGTLPGGGTFMVYPILLALLSDYTVFIKIF